MAFAKRRLLGSGRVRFTGIYLDPSGRERSVGTFDSKRVALHEARAAEAAIEAGNWVDPSHGKITFREYVEKHWWPSRHLELSTRASYRSYLDKHFVPFFGDMPMRSILPLGGAGMGNARRGFRSVAPVRREVPRHAAQRLQAGSPRSGDPPQPGS